MARFPAKNRATEREYTFSPHFRTTGLPSAPPGNAPLPWDPELLGTVQAPYRGVMWLGDLAQLSPQAGPPSGGRARFAGCLVQHFGADYGQGGIGLLVPVFRSTTPLPAGEWIYLPARRSPPLLDEPPDLTG